MIVYLAPLTALIGALAYGLGNGKVSAMGLWAFAVGLHATLLLAGQGHPIHLP